MAPPLSQLILPASRNLFQSFFQTVLPVLSQAITNLDEDPVVRCRGDHVRVFAAPVIYPQDTLPGDPWVGRRPGLRGSEGAHDSPYPLPVGDDQALGDQGGMDRRVGAGEHLDGHDSIWV